jgi:hypothetical protein
MKTWFRKKKSATPAAQRLSLRWDRQNTQERLTISDDGLTLSWDTDQEFAWLGSQTTGRLCRGIYAWDFRIDSIADNQIGVGLMLDPPD